MYFISFILCLNKVFNFKDKTLRVCFYKLPQKWYFYYTVQRTSSMIVGIFYITSQRSAFQYLRISKMVSFIYVLYLFTKIFIARTCQVIKISKYSCLFIYLQTKFTFYCHLRYFRFIFKKQILVKVQWWSLVKISSKLFGKIPMT